MPITEEQQARWWLSPLLTASVLGSFMAYTAWIAFQEVGLVGPYLSPLNSPLVGDWPVIGTLLAFIPFKIPPAILILWVPIGFRATCYYYRKAYYRAFFNDPVACARGEPGFKVWKYGGERRFPFVLFNLHRYFYYGALVILAFLYWDTYQAFIFDGRFGIGVGSLLFTANIVLLTLYSVSCHCLKHLSGGNLDCFTGAPAGDLRHKTWGIISVLNRYHMLFAWMSLLVVMGSDIYVRLLQWGILHDVRLV